MNLILKIWIWITFLRNRGVLPSESEIKNPEMKYEEMSGSFIWEDEGPWELRDHHLVDAFKYAIHHRMTLVVGLTLEVGAMRSKTFDKGIYKLAKRYFPDWIGFQDSRCTYNPQLADRMIRIKKVANRNFQRLLDESNKMGELHGLEKKANKCKNQ